MPHCCYSQCMLSDNVHDEFIQWLVEILGPVLMGNKPAEILSFSHGDKSSPEKIENIQLYLSRCKRVKYRIITYKKSSVKVLFYNTLTLDKTLQESRNIIFLRKNGYPDEYNMNKYIEHVIKKIKKGSIPHEIGVFLGYPLKDIMGFMGHPSLKLTKVNGWRIYGNPKISDEKYESFLLGRNKIKELLLTNTPENILASI
ncbi:MAG: DUF3793 family protein [Clostridia bacterium]|nr:DUF3793 family protein [Clostridia bacterium]